MKEEVCNLINYLLENDLWVCISPMKENEIYFFTMDKSIYITVENDMSVRFDEYMHKLQTDSKIIHTTRENICPAVFKELLNYL